VRKRTSVLEHKSGNISETRRDRGKVTTEGLYRKSPTLFRTIPSPTRPPTASFPPRLGVRNPHPELQSLLSQERVKLYELQIWPGHSQCPFEHNLIKYFGEKGAWAYPLTAQIFWVPPIIPGTGKDTNFKFCTFLYTYS